MEDNEILEETEAKQEDAPVLEENKPEESAETPESSIDALLPHSVAIEKESPDAKPYNEIVEQARVDIAKSYKKSRMISNISMLVAVALLVGAFILILQKKSLFVILGYSIAGATLVAMVVFYIMTRNRLPKKVKDYVALVNTALNQHAFNPSEFQEMKTDPTDKLELSDVAPERVFKDMNSIVSRNVVKGLYLSRSVLISDLGLRYLQGRKTENLFIGKYISYKNDLHFENRYIVRLKGEKEIDVPNDIEDLVVLEDNEKMVIYGPEGHKYKEDLGKEFYLKKGVES